MKRNLIALAITLGLAAAAAVAEPTLDMYTDRGRLNAPEATSYQADSQAAGVRPKRDELAPFSP